MRCLLRPLCWLRDHRLIYVNRYHCGLHWHDVDVCTRCGKLVDSELIFLGGTDA